MSDAAMEHSDLRKRRETSLNDQVAGMAPPRKERRRCAVDPRTRAQPPDAPDAPGPTGPTGATSSPRMIDVHFSSKAVA
jgi:hypothetical protein